MLARCSTPEQQPFVVAYTPNVCHELGAPTCGAPTRTMLFGYLHLQGFAWLALLAGVLWASANLLDARALWRHGEPGAGLRLASALAILGMTVSVCAGLLYLASTLQGLGGDALQVLGGYAGLTLVPGFVLLAGAYFSLWRRVAAA